MSERGWIGVDLDGTLAHYDHWRGARHIGEPIPAMMDRVKQWLAEDRDVRIFTARVYEEDGGRADISSAVIVSVIQDWLESHGLPRLPVTNVKDFGMLTLYDDRAVSIEKNTGRCLTIGLESS